MGFDRLQIRGTPDVYSPQQRKFFAGRAVKCPPRNDKIGRGLWCRPIPVFEDDVSMAQASARDPVLVTGASGFVGAAVAAALRRDGYHVRVLVRASSPRTNIDPADEVFIGDMRDRASVAAAMRGARYLIHTAADYRLWAPSPAD